MPPARQTGRVDQKRHRWNADQGARGPGGFKEAYDLKLKD
jgi:hypothetical protein